MGGIGSGCYYRSRKTTVNDCTCPLDINSMIKLGAIPAQGSRLGGWHWTDPNTGEQVSSIRYEADTRDPHHAFLRLKYTVTDTGEKLDYKIRLERTRPNYGGWRWWFICPYTGKRVTKLYLPYGGRKFASRHAYGLPYACQSEAPHDRTMRKMWKLKSRLGGHDEYSRRPKGMHRKTHERLCNQIWEAEEIADLYFLQKMAPLAEKYFPDRGAS